jgi:arylsulfatase A-like enzyme
MLIHRTSQKFRTAFRSPRAPRRRGSSIGQVLLIGLCLLQSLVGSAATVPSSKTRPNLVFILTDDQRFDSMGCAGNPIIQTPNVDRLASSGVRFVNHFATTAICCVSRASILSGQYERRHGIGNFSTPFSQDQWTATYPMLLRAAGYRTGFIGKFGVGNAKQIAAKKGLRLLAGPPRTSRRMVHRSEGPDSDPRHRSFRQ